MESKTKHRILGVIVVAGIAALSYPILQSNTDTLPDQKLVTAPPFPDQSIQVSTADVSIDTESDALPADFQVQEDNLAAATIEPVAPAEEPRQVAVDIEPIKTSQAASMQGPMTSKEDHDQCVIIDIRPPSLADAKEVTAPTPVKSVVKKASIKSVKKPTKKLAHKPVKKKVVKHNHEVAKKKHKASKPVIYSKISNQKLLSTYRQQPLNDNGLLQLKNAAWVIQLGSFKDKANALKLVNKLRSKGYRAFIQKYSAATGEHTRVFVGPEHHQKSARIVAAELQKGLKLRGIVISYKPFTL